MHQIVLLNFAIHVMHFLLTFCIFYQIPIKAESPDEDFVEDEEDDEDEKNDVDFDEDEDNETMKKETEKLAVTTEKPDFYQKDEKENSTTEKPIIEEKKEELEKDYKTETKTDDVVIEDTIYRDDYDYNHPDDELDKNEESIEGSGAGIDFGMLCHIFNYLIGSYIKSYISYNNFE